MELIIVDTSIWIDHLRRANLELNRLIATDQCVLHPYVLAEIALGNLPDWSRRISRLAALPSVEPLAPAELLQAIARLELQGSGLGFVDAHLLGVASIQPNMRLWTRDRRLAEHAEAMSLRADLPTD